MRSWGGLRRPPGARARTCSRSDIGLDMSSTKDSEALGGIVLEDVQGPVASVLQDHHINYMCLVHFPSIRLPAVIP